MLGFKDDVYIPVVVVSPEVMALLSRNHLSIHRVELIAISEKGKKKEENKEQNKEEEEKTRKK